MRVCSPIMSQNMGMGLVVSGQIHPETFAQILTGSQTAIDAHGVEIIDQARAFLTSKTMGDSGSGEVISLVARPFGGGDGGGGGSRRGTVAMNKRYRDGLAIFKKRCTDYEVIRQFVHTLFDSDVLGIRSTFGLADKINVCDIGCGDGTVTLDLVTSLLGNTKAHVHMDGVEPVGEYEALTRQKLSDLRIGNLTVSFHSYDAEQYFRQRAGYDLIFSSHSIYFFPIETIQDIWKSLNGGGYFVVMAMSRRSIMARLKDLFAPMATITADDVVEFIRDKMAALPHEISEIDQPSVLDFEGIELHEDRGKLPEETKNLISLMIQRDIDDLTQSEYAAARNAILGQLNAAKLILYNTGLIFKKT